MLCFLFFDLGRMRRENAAVPLTWPLAKCLGLRGLDVLSFSLFGLEVLVDGRRNGRYESEHEKGGDKVRICLHGEAPSISGLWMIPIRAGSQSSSTGPALGPIGHLVVAMLAGAYMPNAAFTEQVGRQAGSDGVAARNRATRRAARVCHGDADGVEIDSCASPWMF